MPNRRDSVEGGGSSGHFPWSPNFRGLLKSTRFSGGGVAELFRGLPEPTQLSRGRGGGRARNFPLMGPFYNFALSQRGGRAP